MYWKIEKNYLYYGMGCSNCKNKDSVKKEIKKTADSVGRAVVWFFIIWSLLAIYGLYSLIIKFI